MKQIIKISFLFLVFISSTISYSQLTSGLIGQNYWLPDMMGSVWPQVGTMKPEIIRIGGIAFNHTPRMSNTWYDGVLNQIESIGAEPMVQISEEWSDAEFQLLMEHFIATNRQITYFSIGNEPDHNDRITDVNVIIAYYNRLGPKIRTFYPNCILIGPCWANFYEGFITSKYLPFIDGTKNTKDTNGKYLLNVFSFHSYASAFADNGTGIFDLSKFKTRMDLLLPKITTVNATRPADQQLSWSLTEFHTTYDNTSINIGGTIRTVPESHKTYNFYAGQYFAQLYGYAIEMKAFGMMPWSIYEAGGARTDADLGIFDAGQIPRSTYYHTQMLTQNLRDNAITNTTTKGDVEIVSLQDNTGITVMVMNTGATYYPLSLKLNLAAATAQTLNITVNAGLNKEIIDDITAYTTKLFVFNNNGDLTKTITYTKTNAENKQAPSTVYATIVHAVPGLIQAEEFSAQTGLQTETTLDSLGGQDLGYTGIGDWAEYKIDATYDGQYKIDFRIASLSGNAELALLVDGQPMVTSLPIASTTDWQKWKTLTTTATLTKGTHTIRMNVVKAGFNLNWINWSFLPAAPVIKFSAPTKDTTIIAGKTLYVLVSATQQQGVDNIQLYLDGTLVRQENIAPYEWGLGTNDPLLNLSVGTHVLKAIATSISVNDRTSTAEKTITITVTKQSQTITFAALATKTFGDAAFTLTATASSGLAVTYASSNPAVATVNGNTVTIIGVGSAVITANQAGNATYNGATSVTQPLVVGKANQAITFGAIGSKSFGDAAFTLTATASSGLPIEYTSSDPDIAIVTGNVVTIISPGSTIITASQEGDDTFNAATGVTQTFIVMLTTANIDMIINNNMLIYPQPASNQIVIEFNSNQSSKISDVSVFSLNGQFITKKTIDLNNTGIKYIIDISDLEGGVYIIEFVVEEKRIVKKIIVE